MQQSVNSKRPRAALFTRHVIAAGLLAAATCLTALPNASAAQGLFSPAITVNEDVITNYELEQRALFLSVLGSAKGDPLVQARKDLIDDRLKRAKLAEVGLTLTEAEITEGMEELAGRANLSLDEFLTAQRPDR